MLKPLLALLFLSSIQINGEPLSYKSAVEIGKISAITYTKEGENRPITFVFNGGPGAGAVWLHIGTLGPRRLVTNEEGQLITPPYQIVDNTETILDLTDLVFIDPVGTGLSTIEPEEDDENPYSITGDIHSVGLFIRDYLTKNQRWNSPKYIAGESYGAIRAAGLADYLQNEFGIFLNGVLFISAAIDYQTFLFDTDNILPYFLFLPTYATTAWYHGLYSPESTLEEVAQSARDFVYKTYAPSLICNKCFDSESIYEDLSQITGLSPEIIHRYRGRISDDIFTSHLLESKRQMVGRFDSRMVGYANSFYQDPTYTFIQGIFSGAFHEYLHKELSIPSSYTLLSMEVNSKWNHREPNAWGYPSMMNGLRNALIINPQMKIFAACGYYDLATPFATVEYCFDHLDVPNISVQMEYYEGGHMFYLTPSARIKFKQDLIRFYQGTP
jgi:carboxypeptidase C (cathepsin A)